MTFLPSNKPKNRGFIILVTEPNSSKKEDTRETFECFSITETNFSNYFGNYDLVKALEKNESKLDFSGLDIKKFVKRKAKECTLILPRTLKGLQKRENRRAFKKAFMIAYNEGVLFSSFPLLGKRLFEKAFLFVTSIIG